MAEFPLPPRMIDLTGRKVGRLTVTGWAFKKNDKWHWICDCECGTTKAVSHFCLTQGSTFSCGCLQKEKASQNSKLAIAAITKHGESKTPEWTAWKCMIQRCENPNLRSYANYGGRGIKVCDRWKGEQGYQHFIADMGRRPSDKHSLDREDVNGDYTPDNCRWADDKTQQRNRRDNHLITAWGRTQTVAAWVEETGIPFAVISRRDRQGWEPEVNLSTPAKKYKPRCKKT